METALYGNYKIIFTIAGSSLLLSSKIELFATVVKGFQLEIIIRKSSIVNVGGDADPPLITIWQSKFSVSTSNCHLVQFNCDLWN